MKQRSLLFAMLMALMATAFVVSPKAVQAASYSAGTVNDLLAAITSANADPQADTIILTVNITLTSAAETDAAYGKSGLPAITSNITIEGQGHSISRSAAIGTSNFRIFRVATGAHLTLYNLTISGGKAVTGSVCNAACGGGLFNEGTVTAIHTAFSSNSAENGGGFYNNSDTATIT
nr:hypothetical protein [Anaerolineae bacterium]